jgi:hypothetical protein
MNAVMKRMPRAEKQHRFEHLSFSALSLIQQCHLRPGCPYGERRRKWTGQRPPEPLWAEMIVRQ